MNKTSTTDTKRFVKTYFKKGKNSTNDKFNQLAKITTTVTNTSSGLKPEVSSMSRLKKRLKRSGS